jgi:hypothetical protein
MTNTMQSSTQGPASLDPLGTPVALSPGPYSGWRDGQKPFAIEADAKPLAALVEDAFTGSRIYEFMAISRPGDIYGYVRVRLADVSEDVVKEAQRLKPRWVRSRQQHEWGEGYLPLNRFDGLFNWDGDDTTPEARCWLGFRSGSYWENSAVQLLTWVRAKQQELRSMGDWLTLREIGYIDQGIHRRDFISEIERRCLATAQPKTRGLPPAVYSLIDELVSRDNVQSVSAPYADYQLWRTLCRAQLVRSDRTGFPPEEAFPLSGPDGGLWHVPYEDWGADIHIPYEGVCMADLLIQPSYRRANLDADEEGGQLVKVFHSWGYSLKNGWACHYVLTPEDLGQLACAHRSEVGDGWVLYESKQPYVPNPRCKPHLLKAYENDE